jgi:hypothetical protein
MDELGGGHGASGLASAVVGGAKLAALATSAGGGSSKRRRRGEADAAEAGVATKKPRSVCPHQRKRSKCKECGGGSICPHQRQMSNGRSSGE